MDSDEGFQPGRLVIECHDLFMTHLAQGFEKLHSLLLGAGLQYFWANICRKCPTDRGDLNFSGVP
jgi:hypothetical protein